MVKNFLRRYWIFIVLAFLATIVIGIVFNKPKVSPKENDIPLSSSLLPQLTSPNFKKAKITGRIIDYRFEFSESIKTPTSLPVYQVQPRTFFNYAKPIKPGLEGEKIITSTNQAGELVKDFLVKNSRWSTELENGIFNVEYFKAGGYETFKVNDFSQADILSLHFYPQINQYLVFGNSPFSGLLEVWIGKNGKIQKVKDFLGNYDQTSFTDYPLVSLKEAEQMIRNQKETVVSITAQEETYGSSEIRISSVSLNKVYLAYFQEEDLPSLLQPIWVFEGNTILKDGSKSEIAIYLPAVLEKYLK